MAYNTQNHWYRRFLWFHITCKACWEVHTSLCNVCNQVHVRCVYTYANRCFYLDWVRVQRMAQHSENPSTKLVFKKCVYCINALKIQYHTTAYNSNEMSLTIGQYKFCPHWMNCLLNPKEEHILKRELIFLKLCKSGE